MGKISATSQLRTPQGGMNQDDSLITPSKNMAGRNAFEVGDYRYALNARIGSSRSNNIGDLENIKDTTEVTDFSKVQGLFTNPSFDGSISPWQIINVGSGTWLWLNGAVFVNPGSEDILYQPITTLNRTDIIVRYKYIMGSVQVSGFQLKLIYLQGTTELSNEVVDTRTGGDAEYFIGEHFLNIPANCDGIGMQVTGTPLSAINSFSLFDFQVFGFVNATVTGTEKVIGKYEDREFLRLYYAVWNSEGNHAIRYYDLQTDTIYELMRWSGLNWQSTDFVSMAKLDNWMAITERRNGPRLFDVDTIADTFFSLGSDFREFHLSFHKWSPNNPPVPRVYYDAVTNNYDKLKNKAYQFSTRINYVGNLNSRYSPISKAAITTYCGNFYSAGTPRLITSIEVDIAGSFLDEPGASVQYNYFGHDSVKFTEVAESIDIVYRESTTDIWKKWKTVSMDTYTRYHYFNGDANQTPVPVEDFIQPFDTVPFKAGTVAAIDNRFVFGDCLDEKDPAPNIVLTDVGFVTDPSADWNDSFAASFPQFVGALGDNLRRLNALSDLSFKYRAIIKVGIQYFAENGWRSAVYTNDSMTFLVDFTTKAASNRLIGLTFKIPADALPPDWAVGYQIMRTNTLNISSFMYGVANRFIPMGEGALPAAGDAIAPNADALNRIETYFDNAKLTVGEMGANNSNFSQEYNDFLLGNNLAFHVNGYLRNSTAVVLANASRIYIDIRNWYNGAKATALVDQPLNNLFYNFRHGDRVRLLGSDVGNPTADQTKIYDCEILEFDGNGLVVKKPEGLLWLPTTLSIHAANNFSIEVYSPQVPRDRDHIFYECGEWYPVLYPGKDNRAFSKKDWVYTNNTAVTSNTYGPFDIFHKIPLFYGDVVDPHKIVYRDNTIGGGNDSSGVHASMSPDPDQSYDLWNNNRNSGRPALSYQQIPVAKFKTTQLRFGGKIVEESFINNLNRMREQDQFIYPSEYGRVRMLVNTSNAQVESVGSILLAIGERETWSIYVNRTTLEDLSGRSQVALSDKVLGSYNTLLGSYGTMNPESVSVYNGRVAFWDAIHGAWVRYGRDGLTDLSEYKMRNWFRELANLLYTTYVTDTPALVISEYDHFNDELVTFISHSTLPSTFRSYSTYKGAIFSEEDTRWKTVHSYTPEMMGKLGNQLFLFRGGEVFKAEQGTNYSTFFGTKYNVQWEPVMNDEPFYKKSWQALANVATHKWSVERMLSEYRGAKTVQQSTIPMANFDEREDNYYASIPRDVNTGVSNPQIEGNRMRSKAIQVLMQLDPAVVELSLLHYVFAECIDSPKNA